jgi:Protein of unknown function (DUF2459)
MYDGAETARASILRPLRCLRLLVLALLLAGVGGCTTVISPPAEVAQPASVAVLDHGRHTSLIVGTQDGAMIRYAYGDWRWYALRQTGLAEASGAILGSSKAALGRRRHPGPVTPEAVARQINVSVEHGIYLEVEADAAQALIERLDAIFRANFGALVVNQVYGLDFVPHPERYSLFHNSNSMVASWLKEMGVAVDGWALLARWACGDDGRTGNKTLSMLTSLIRSPVPIGSLTAHVRLPQPPDTARRPASSAARCRPFAAPRVRSVNAPQDSG